MMRKRLWVIIAVFLFLGIVAFSVPNRDPCNAHRLYVNDQPVSLFASPEEAFASMADGPLLQEVNQLSLSCEGGRPEHDIQLYIRMAEEKDGTVIISPYATLYNFSSTNNKAEFSMNDVLDLDEKSDYDLVLFERITYEKTAAATKATSQYAVFRWIDC